MQHSVLLIAPVRLTKRVSERPSDGALLWQTFVSVAVTAVSSVSIHLKKRD